MKSPSGPTPSRICSSALIICGMRARVLNSEPPRAAALAAGATARTASRRTRRCTRPTGSSPTRARQDAAVYAVDAPAGGHRRRRALFEAHPLRLFGRDDPLRQTARRIQLDVLTRLAAEE